MHSYQGQSPLRNRTALQAMLACLLVLPVASAFPQDKQQRKQESANTAHAAQIDAAKQVAVDWLKLVDEENYADSWKQAAPFLKEHVPLVAWEKRLNEIRKPIDPMVERTLSTTEYREQLPGLPAGQYVAFVWETYFGVKHQMLESMVLSFTNGEWKAVGYAVQ